jgi:hypothetical protein
MYIRRHTCCAEHSYVTLVHILWRLLRKLRHRRVHQPRRPQRVLQSTVHCAVNSISSGAEVTHLTQALKLWRVDNLTARRGSSAQRERV